MAIIACLIASFTHSVRAARLESPDSDPDYQAATKEEPRTKCCCKLQTANIPCVKRSNGNIGHNYQLLIGEPQNGKPARKNYCCKDVPGSCSTSQLFSGPYTTAISSTDLPLSFVSMAKVFDAATCLPKDEALFTMIESGLYPEEYLLDFIKKASPAELNYLPATSSSSPPLWTCLHAAAFRDFKAVSESLLKHPDFQMTWYGGPLEGDKSKTLATDVAVGLAKVYLKRAKQERENEGMEALLHKIEEAKQQALKGDGSGSMNSRMKSKLLRVARDYHPDKIVELEKNDHSGLMRKLFDHLKREIEFYKSQAKREDEIRFAAQYAKDEQSSLAFKTKHGWGTASQVHDDPAAAEDVKPEAAPAAPCKEPGCAAGTLWGIWDKLFGGTTL